MPQNWIFGKATHLTLKFDTQVHLNVLFKKASWAIKVCCDNEEDACLTEQYQWVLHVSTQDSMDHLYVYLEALKAQPCTDCSYVCKTEENVKKHKKTLK